MLKTTIGVLFLLLAGLLTAQVPQHDYFAPALCQKEGVRIVSVYEAQIADAATKAAPSSRIRLESNMVRQTFYDLSGLPVRSLRFQNEGKTMVTEILRTYNDQNMLAVELQRQYNTNFADSTKLLQTQRRVLYYNDAGQLLSTVNSLSASDKETPIDSVSYEYDLAGKLTTERVFAIDGPTKCILKKYYKYSDGILSRVSLVDDRMMNSDAYKLDGKGRVIEEAYSTNGDLAPRMLVSNTYNGLGQISSIKYITDATLFPLATTVAARNNKFDSKGKLVEGQFDYGDGKRLYEFYDYTYWVED
jgi:hypothetical protein